MKKALAFFISIWAATAFGSDFTAPNVDSVSHSLEDMKSQATQSLVFDPVLDVNPNRGTFGTSIAIPVPPNLVHFSGFKLNYSSSVGENIGFGIGWRSTLPFISRNNKPGSPATYITRGQLGTLELAPTHENADAYRAVVAKLIPGGDAQVFRPLVEENFTVFIRVAKGAATLGWIALETSGRQWLFSNEGQPQTIFDRHSNSIQLSWREGHLASISETRAQKTAWSMAFSYTEAKQEFPSWTAQGWFTLPLGLKSISYGSRQLEFETDSDGYLLRAAWAGGLRSLFTGHYSSQTLAHQNTANTFEKNDSLVPYRMKRDEELKGYKIEHDPDVLDYLVDLNGDGRTDRIRFDRSTDKSNFAFLSKFCDGDEKKGDLDGYNRNLAKMNSDIPATVEMAIERPETNSTEWIADPSLKINFDLRPYSNAIDMEVIDGFLWVGDTPKCKSYTAVPRAMFFVDLNGDGRKDIVDCGYDSETTAKTWSIGEGSDKKDHSNVVLAALSFTNPELVAGHDFSNPFSSPGKPAKIYTQSIDAAKTQTLLAQTGGTSASSASFLTGSSQWIEEPHSGFSCHRGSLFFDANHDGRIDVLTGNTLYLASEKPGEYLAVKVDPRRFFEPGDSNIDMTDTNLTLIDTDGNGKLEVRQARSVEPEPSTGLFELVRNHTTEKFAPPTAAQRLLTQMDSPFGGEVDISYTFNQGVWAIDKVVRDPKGKQPKSTTSYSYSGPMIDPFRGLFIGFSETRQQETSSDSRETPRTVDRLFYKDLDPLAALYSSRSRLNGLLMLSRDLDTSIASGSQVLHETTHSPEAVALSPSRILVYDKQSIENIFQPGTTRILDQRKTIKWMPANNSLWATDSSGNRILPLQTTTEDRGPGLSSRHSDQLLSYLKKTVRSYLFDRASNVQMLQSRAAFEKDEKTVGSTLSIAYDPTTFDALQSCENNRCTQYGYDSLGRLTQINSNFGRKEEITYSGDSALPKTHSTINGTEVETHDDITGQWTDLTMSTGASYHRDLSPDGILTRVTARESDSKSMKVFFELFADAQTVSSKTQLKYFDSRSELNFDGFGRIESSITDLGARGKKHSGTTLYGFGSDVIARSRPQIGTNDSGISQYEATRDALGRIVQERDGLVGEAATSLMNTEYVGACKTVTTNGSAKTSSCKNLFDVLLSQSSGTEELAFDSNSDGHLTGLPSLGIEWRVSNHGEIESSHASFEDADSSTLKGAAEWAEAERAIEPVSEGFKYTDAYGFIRVNDANGRLLHAGKSKDSNSPINLTDSSEERVYKNGVLVSRELSLLKNRDSAPYLSERFAVNGFGTAVGLEALGYKITSESDEYGRPKTRVISKDGKSISSFSYDYENGSIARVAQNGKPFIDISRDALDRVELVTYGSGVKTAFEYQGSTPRLSKTKVTGADGAALWSESLTEMPGTHSISSRETQSALHDVLRDVFQYNAGDYQIQSAQTKSARVRSDSGRVSKLGKAVVKWSGDFLAEAEGRQFFYDGEGVWIASCPSGKNPLQNAGDCVIRIDEDTYVNQGSLVSLVRVEKHPLAVLVNGQMYPLISNHLSSIVAAVDTDGRSLLWERAYSAWGEKKTFVATDQARSHERAILWGFAGLMEQPRSPTSEHALYWSASRVYSPELHEWMSVDPTLKWNPDSLVARPGNWHSVRYAANRPLDYVDASGHFITLAPAGAAGLVGFAGAYVAARAMGQNNSDAISMGFATGIGTFVTVASAGIMTGAAIEAGINIVGANALGLGFSAAVGIPTQAALQGGLLGTTNFTGQLAGVIGTPGSLAFNLFAPELQGVEAILAQSTIAYFGALFGFAFDSAREAYDAREAPFTEEHFTMPEIGHELNERSEGPSLMDRGSDARDNESGVEHEQSR